MFPFGSGVARSGEELVELYHGSISPSRDQRPRDPLSGPSGRQRAGSPPLLRSNAKIITCESERVLSKHSVAEQPKPKLAVSSFEGRRRRADPLCAKVDDRRGRAGSCE
jgi:hypothetical protein